ncbi:MAG: sugar ABC transporter ATP-binding protein [Clostridiales bacterium]|nr:sugar ABC transporter ATP-binding protein [Clostridiales bacterium]
MKGINKSFGNVSVLKDVDFTLQEGEVHALVGGNGAGKSTLMKIMTGVYSLDSGEIYINGERKNIQNTKDAKENGIAMIFQELSLVPTMTIAENIFLGEEITKTGFRDVSAMNKRAKEILNDLGIFINPELKVNQLSVGMSQMIEIAKAISKNARILVLDEPTASLSDSETVQLFRIIRQLKENGVSMVYISHRMNEILSISDAVTILRDGKKIITDNIENLDLDKIISHLVGGEASQKKFEWVEREYDANKDLILKVKNLKISDKIQNISFELQKGEILGIAGLMGSGRTEILETLFGIRKKLGGTIELLGKEININSSQDAIRYGFALIPEDRRRQGLVLGHSVKSNAILPYLRNLLIGKTYLISEKASNELANDDIKRLNIKTDSIHKRINLLSGGNQQKVVIAKWLNMNPKIMMLDEPTAGVDIGAKTEIIEIIRKFADEGKGVIFVSSELTELLSVCDRIITIFDGRITGSILRKNINSEEELQNAIQRSE